MLSLLTVILVSFPMPSLELSQVHLKITAAKERAAALEGQDPGQRLAQASQVGDAKDVVDGNMLSGMTERVQVMFRLAVEMTEDNWVRTGGEGAQALKKLFSLNKAVKAKVAERCANKAGDCSWKQKDALMCELLLLVGGSDTGLGDPRILENALVAHAGSTGPVGVDWTARAAMIAKWKEQVRVPRVKGSSEFAEMKQRVLSHRYFQKLVNRTCLDLDRYRPDCRPIARDALFCEAAAQASTIAVGTDAGHKIIMSRMEKQLPQAQMLLGTSPLTRQPASSLDHQGMEEDRNSIEEAQEEWEQRARERQQDLDEAKWDAAPRLARLGVSAWRSTHDGITF